MAGPNNIGSGKVGPVQVPTEQQQTQVQKRTRKKSRRRTLLGSPNKPVFTNRRNDLRQF